MLLRNMMCGSASGSNSLATPAPGSSSDPEDLPDLQVIDCRSIAGLPTVVAAEWTPINV